VHGKAQPAHTVGDGVVHLLEQCGAAVREPFDERELPQRSRPVQRSLGQRRHEVEELAHAARSGRGDVPEVIVEIETRVVDPFGRRYPKGRGDDQLVEAFDGVDG